MAPESNIPPFGGDWDYVHEPLREFPCLFSQTSIHISPIFIPVSGPPNFSVISGTYELATSSLIS